MKPVLALLLLTSTSCAQSTSPSSGIAPEAQLMDLNEHDETALCDWAQQRVEPFDEGRPYSCWGWSDEEDVAGGSLSRPWELRPLFERFDHEWVCGDLMESFTEEPVASFETCINNLRGYPERLRHKEEHSRRQYESCVSECVEPPCGCTEYSGFPNCFFPPSAERPIWDIEEEPTHLIWLSCFPP